VTIAGPIEVVLYVSSSAKGTDFMARLVDVYPDGKSINLTDDAFRVRYRDGFDKKVLMRPGEVYPIRLTNMVTAIQFAKGHRIRLDISCSSFPLYERNLTTGGNNYDETEWVVAENSIHHGVRLSITRYIACVARITREGFFMESLIYSHSSDLT
jgi:putative CocE/NonD family hydrolase